MRTIDYKKVLENVDTMINTLEWDASRSPGKTKQNIAELESLYNMRDTYAKKAKPPAKKPNPPVYEV